MQITRKDEAYLALRERILQQRILPGDPLRETHLAQELGISRTPLREAIRQLSRDGLVECPPHCGARVIQPRPKLVSDIFQIREALEGMAARQAAKNISSAHLRELRAFFESLRSAIAASNCGDVGDSIHGELLNICGNDELRTLMNNYRDMIVWFQRLASQIPGRLVEAYREHEAILCALEAGDPDWAERAARAHVRNTLRDLLPHLAEPPKKKRSSRTPVSNVLIPQ